MHVDTGTSVEAVRAVLVETLGLEGDTATMDAGTRLFGSLPELDSMAVLEVLLALEDRFGITIDGEDVTAESFESLGSLTELVRDQATEDAPGHAEQWPLRRGDGQAPRCRREPAGVNRRAATTRRRSQT